MPNTTPLGLPDRVVIPTGSGESRIWVRPDRIEGDLQYFHDHDLAGIECDGALLPLVSSAKPRNLMLRGLDNDEQLAVLHEMTWLRHLGGYSSDAYKPALDLGRFPLLESFDWGNWTPKLIFPAEMPKLQWLGLSKYREGRGSLLPTCLPALTTLSPGYLGTAPALPPLPDAPGLVELVLVVAGLVELGDVAGRYPRIERLHLGHLSKLASLEAVRALRHLRRVELERLRSLTDLSPLGDCPQLREVRIDGCKNISSIRWVESVQLERFEMFGSRVADGDLSPLFGVEHVAFDNLRHYSHRLEEIRAATSSSTAEETPRLDVVDVGGSSIEVHLETDDPRARDQWIGRLPDLVSAARRALQEEAGTEALHYAQHHIDEVDAEEWGALGFDGPPAISEVLRLLEPISLWGDPEEGLHLDWTLGEDLTQYVLSFEVLPDGALGEPVMES